MSNEAKKDNNTKPVLAAVLMLLIWSIVTLGMHHRAYLKGVYINEKGKPKYRDDICQIENLKSVKDNFLKKVMTNKEKFIYNNDDDVYFTFNRMKEIFPTLEIVE
jgi:hypothetical protein